MRILLVKTSSLGDVIHNLPVVSDLKRAYPQATIDWCVEESFVDIPRLHPGVAGVIPVAVRRWRRALFARATWRATWREIADFRRRIALARYDAILDTQGLLKSALIARLAHGPRLGYAAEVAREPLAARFYDRAFVIPRNAHAVERNRWLAAAAFDLPAATLGEPPDYGISAPAIAAPWLPARYAVLFTATSRDDKLWAEESWVQLAQALAARGIGAVLPAGSAVERARAERIAGRVAGSVVAPPQSLRDLAGVIAGARLAIGVDTGLAHLATALRVPTIALFMASDPTLTGVHGGGFCRNLGTRGRAPTLAEVLTAAQPELR